MALTDYERKRDFKKTPEPKPVEVKKAGRSYVIQKHAASHLHYDFRLELEGVLKSWAVPKGPSLDPTVKRLAMQVEDHPVAYGTFEGIIPQGEYGGGTVMLWDQGTWEPIGDPHQGYHAGNLKFVLHGEKLRGAWALIRTKRSDSSKGAPQWLLIKEGDDEAKPAADGDILEEAPLSVVSSRDLDEIAASEDKVWSSGRAVTKKKGASKKDAGPKKSKRTKAPIRVEGVKEPMPSETDVQLATLVDKAPTGDEWFHEIKFDGYRMICRKDGADIHFMTRNHNDWTSKLSSIVTAAKQLDCKQAILDGEVVVLREDGTTDFQSLQNAFKNRSAAALHYFVFDLLYLDGQSLAHLPLEDRKAALQALLGEIGPRDTIQYSQHVIGSGQEFKDQACKLNLEGMVCKRRDRPYIPGRGVDWLKVKCIHDEEFVIGGFTDPSGSRTGFGALLVGFYDKQQKLHYAGKVGTGFTERELNTLFKQLQGIEQNSSPFFDLQRKTGDARNAHWVKPELIGQFKYASRTNEDKLRHASFQGLREDKSATEVTLEKPVTVKQSQQKVKVQTAGVEAPSAKTSRAKPGKESNDSSILAEWKQQYDASQQSFEGGRLTHPDKIFYPDSGFTKLDVAAYYASVAKWILPQLSHRPVVLVRCPEGITGERFYQKHPGLGASDFLRQIPIRESSKTENYFVIDDLKGLIAVAQMGALEIHVWGSQEDKIELPDRLVFDLDPDPVLAWPKVVLAAKQIRDFLKKIGLESFVKTTGGKGLHLVVPIQRKYEWDDVKAFCKGVAESIVKADPTRFTSNMSKAVRTNKIFLDYLRNGRGATAVCAYSTRARDGATVAMPLAWEELDGGVKADSFTIESAAARLASLKRDPWMDLPKLKQSLTEPMKTLSALAKP